MTYLIKQEDGTERTGLNEQELIRLAKEHGITPHTPVKKTLMSGWFEAQELKFLKDIFAEQEAEARKDTAEPDTSPEQKTSFEKKYIPVHAGLLLRFQAFSFDAFLLIVLFALLSAAGTFTLYCMGTADRTSPRVKKLIEKRDRQEKLKAEKSKTEKEKTDAPDEKKKSPKPRHHVKHKYEPSALDDEKAGFHFGSTWTDSKAGALYVCLSAAPRSARWCPIEEVRPVSLIVLGAFMFLGFLCIILPLMFKAQTYGMHYFGIFLSDAEDPDREVLENRAFWFGLLTIFTFFLTPVFIVSGKQNIAERLTKTKVIRISSLREK